MDSYFYSIRSLPKRRLERLNPGLALILGAICAAVAKLPKPPTHGTRDAEPAEAQRTFAHLIDWNA